MKTASQFHFLHVTGSLSCTEWVVLGSLSCMSSSAIYGTIFYTLGGMS
jgi:hypothetical protein